MSTLSQLYFDVLDKTEMEGFEPSRRLRDLPHFECGPFGQLGYISNFEQI